MSALKLFEQSSSRRVVLIATWLLLCVGITLQSVVELSVSPDPDPWLTILYFICAPLGLLVPFFFSFLTLPMGGNPGELVSVLLLVMVWMPLIMGVGYLQWFIVVPALVRCMLADARGSRGRTARVLFFIFLALTLSLLAYDLLVHEDSILAAMIINYLSMPTGMLHEFLLGFVAYGATVDLWGIARLGVDVTGSRNVMSDSPDFSMGHLLSTLFYIYLTWGLSVVAGYANWFLLVPWSVRTVKTGTLFSKLTLIVLILMFVSLIFVMWGMPMMTGGPPDIQDRIRQMNSSEYLSEVVEELDLGHIAFNVPQQMTVGEVRDVELLLSLSKPLQELKDELDARGAREGAEIKVASAMEALLTGAGFSITDHTSTTQVVSSEENNRWLWEIRAEEPGRQRLHLTISAVLFVHGTELPAALKTFDRYIEIEVSWPNELLSFVKTNWQWLWTAILVPIGVWLWKRSRRTTQTDSKE